MEWKILGLLLKNIFSFYVVLLAYDIDLFSHQSCQSLFIGGGFGWRAGDGGSSEVNGSG